MKTEFNTETFGIDGGIQEEMTFELTPETDFEKMFIQRACAYETFTVRRSGNNVLLMIGARVLPVGQPVIKEEEKT